MSVIYHLTNIPHVLTNTDNHQAHICGPTGSITQTYINVLFVLH
jgi:hypothetical protein